MTAPELLAGEKVGGSGNPTTFFSRDKADWADACDEEATPEATREPEASATATPAPAEQAPAPSATPAPAATPAPLGAEPTASPAPAP